MTFKDQSFSKRFEAMGDEAEGVFEAVCTEQLKLGWARYGLNRPPIQMHRLPARVRYTPDYLLSSRFMEVQGCGRDQVFKLKFDKAGALHWWNDLLPVELFLWDSMIKRWCIVKLADLDGLAGTRHCVLATFPEGKPYFAYDADAVFDLGSRKGSYDADA